MAYLVLQGVGALAWWAMLFLDPQLRRHFLAPGAPDSTLLAFAPGDIGLFAVASLAVALGLWQRRRWAWPLLCVNAGVVAYVGLYCIALAWLSKGAWLAAALMVPPLITTPAIAWQLRPRSSHELAGSWS